MLVPVVDGRYVICPKVRLADLGTSERPQAQPAVAKRSGPPSCPNCGVPMVSRTSQRGDRAGQRFWGCANYPQCREIVDIRPDP